jgi:hypothetical protein
MSVCVTHLICSVAIGAGGSSYGASPRAPQSPSYWDQGHLQVVNINIKGHSHEKVFDITIP